MNDDYEYKPRNGFDIRIKQGQRGRNAKKSWVKQDVRMCNWESGCRKPAETRVAKSPNTPQEHIWLCTQHAREHNKSWNFFEGMSDTEAKAFRESQRYGGRPTWQMAQNARAGATTGHERAEIDDTIGVMAKEPIHHAQEKETFRDGRKLTKLQVNAFKTMNLPTNAEDNAIRKRYAELVKRFHPDSNEGDRSAEQQLQEVIKAHQILKKAGYC